MFSLIIPYHNREKYLPRTLDSVADASVRPGCIFLVNNASTDGSEKICQKFADSHPELHIVLLNEEKRGAAAARNRALREVTTEWVYFFDSDDELSPEYFSEAIAASKYTHEADLVACQTRMVLENGEEKARAVQYNASPADQILSGQLATQGMWLRTSFLKENGGWNEDLPKWNDWELGVRLLARGAKTTWIRGLDFHRINQHRDSLTGKNFSTTLAGILPALQAVHALSENNTSMLFALSCREAILSAHLRREGSRIESSQMLRRAKQTARECHKASARFFSLLIYIYSRLGGRGGWLLASKIARIAHF